MAVTTERLKREFHFNGMTLADPNPAVSAEQARELLAINFPELATADMPRPEIKNGKQIYRFERSVGSKG